MSVLRISDTSPAVDIEAAIVALRAKAVRWSRADPRRAEVDAQVDELVVQRLACS